MISSLNSASTSSISPSDSLLEESSDSSFISAPSSRSATGFSGVGKDPLLVKLGAAPEASVFGIVVEIKSVESSVPSSGFTILIFSINSFVIGLLSIT